MMMKKLLTLSAIFSLGILSTDAADQFMGNDSENPVSKTGTQNWDTTALLWLPINNGQGSYVAWTNGNSAIFSGDDPIITATAAITVSNITRVADSAANDDGRMDWLTSGAGVLTFNNTLVDHGTTPTYDMTTVQRQINFGGTDNGANAANWSGNIILGAGVNRLLLTSVQTIGPNSSITAASGNTVRFDSQAGNNFSNLTIKLNGGILDDRNNGNPFSVGGLTGNGNLTINGGGGIAVQNLSAGANETGDGIGTLTGASSLILTNGTHTFDIDADTTDADKLALTSGTLTFGGALTVNNLSGTLSSGQIFDLFDAPSIAGAFTATNLPALSGSLEWDLSNLTVDGTIRIGGDIVDEYTGTLYLGDGTSYDNNPATWDISSAFWGLGPVASESVFTNWIDYSSAVIYGTGINRAVNMATNLNVTVNELEWNSTGGAASFVGDGSQTLTITNEMRTVLAQTARQINFSDLTLAGQFNVRNVSRINMGTGTDVAAGTELNLLDVSDIQFVPGTAADHSDLSVTLNGEDTWVYNKSDAELILGNLSGTGEIRMDADSPLTVNNLIVGGISNSATIVADSASAGDMTLGSGTHHFSINPNTGNTDLLDVGAGTLTYGGDLIVGLNNTNMLSLGQTFQLFDATAIEGSFNNVELPESALPAGTVWHNNLEVDGTISVGTPGIIYQTVNFNEFRSAVFPEDRIGPISGSITNSQGTILTLEISVAGILASDPDYVPWLYNSAVGGVSIDGEETRLDSFGSSTNAADLGKLDESDDEALRFKISVSGTPANALTFQSMRLDTFAVNEVLEFSNGGGSTNFQDVGGSDIISYDDVLSGLTPLSINNTNTWYLDATARGFITDGVTNDTKVSFDDIKFLVGYQFESSFDIWAGDFGLEGDDALSTADPDNDGYSNLYEFGLGGNPTNAADTGYTEVGSVDEMGTAYLEYIYAKRTDANAGIVYILEETEMLTLPSWTNDIQGLEVTSGTINEEFDAVTNRLPATESAQFLKLTIEEE